VLVPAGQLEPGYTDAKGGGAMGRSGRGIAVCWVVLLCACGGSAERAASASGSGDGSAGGGSGAGNGASSGAGAATEGTYFMALSLELAPRQPIVFLQSITADGSGQEMSLQPLAATDRKTPVGSAIVAAFQLGEGGVFEVDLPDARIPPEANSITSTEVVADLHLEGTADPASFCGDATGQISKPIDVDLQSSTFRAERVVGTAYPEPPMIDCSGKLADPL
jgi:hypothetical protein